jgi:hypothetical protein
LTVRVDCPCSGSFEVPDSMAGGLANCPACGKATAVPGLRDPFFRALQVGAVAAAGACGLLVGREAGPVAGASAFFALLAALWLLSRAL